MEKLALSIKAKVEKKNLGKKKLLVQLVADGPCQETSSVAITRGRKSQAVAPRLDLRFTAF